MTMRTVLRWNDDWRPGVSGYAVTVDGAPPTVVPSAMFVDPANYADAAAADAVVYGVSAVLDSAAPSDAFDPTDAATLTVRRTTVDAAALDFCTVSGTLLSPLGDALGKRCDVRVEIAGEDRPARYPTAAYLGGSGIVKANWRGEFAVALPRGAAVLLHVPAAALALRFVTPSTASARLEALAVETYDLHRNN